MTTPRSVLIVGAGLAGARCAETLRAEGFEGRVLLVGDEPLPPYERPALSKGFLSGARGAHELLLRPTPFWDEQRIDLVVGSRVVAIDSKSGLARTADGRVLGWDALVLATGARPRRLAFAAPRGVHVLRTLADAAALREDLYRSRHLVVIGGGFVGAEVASTAQALGVQVTILEAGPAPFAGLLGPDLARLLVDRYRAHGVEVRTAATATGFRIRAAGGVQGVTLSDGSELACDTALVAVGVEPAVELVPAAAPRPIFVCGDAGGTNRPLERRRRRRDRRRETSARAAATAAAAAVLLVGPVRPAHPARRRPTGRGRRRPRRRRRGVRRALPDGPRPASRRPRRKPPRDGRHGQT